MNHHGVYGANTWLWSTDDYWKVSVGKFKWAIVRLDSAPNVAQWCYEQRVKVILQAPDTFNKRVADPGQYAKRLWEKSLPFWPYTRLIVLDNEPNLYPERATRWWAEQFTRWYRAVLAHFRYLDSYTSHWKVLHPAFVGHERNEFGVWLEVCRENLVESDGLSAHSYWQDPGLIHHPEFGGSYQRVSELYPGKALYLTEYCPDIKDISGAERASQMMRYLNLTKGKVECACYFILGGTNEWQRFHLPGITAERVGELVLEKGR